MGKWISVYAGDGSGSFKAYVAEAEGGSGSAVVAIQEIFGVNDGMRQICDALAAQGHTAICPDLFWRQEPGIELTDKEEAHWTRALELYNGFDVDKGIDDIATTIAAAREMPGASGKVGAVGYCLGGLLAYLTAARTDVDASIGYYGVGIAGHLNEATGIKAPLMLHVAGADEFVPVEQQQQMHAGLDNHAQVTLHDYPGLDHAFARPDGIHHNAEAAALANSRSATFFMENLE